MENKRLTKKQKLIILSLLLLNSILPVLTGMLIGKCIWSGYFDISDISMTIFTSIFTIANYIAIEIAIMLQVFEIYEQNNYENYKR